MGIGLEFSVIITTFNSEKWIEKTLESLVNQELNFEENIEVIIVDHYSSDDTDLILKRYMDNFPENFILIKNEFSDMSDAENIALRYATGKYVNILNYESSLTETTLQSILTYFNSHDDVDVVATPIYFINHNNEDHWSNTRYEKNQTVNLIENPEYYQIFGSSCFIRKSAIKNIRFPKINYSQHTVFINDVLINNPLIGLCNNGHCESEVVLMQDLNFTDAISTKEYYLGLSENNFKHLIGRCLDTFGYVPQFIQNAIMYHLSIMLNVEDTKKILKSEEVKKFESDLHYVLNYIDDEIILNYSIAVDSAKLNALLLKYDELTPDLLSNFDLDTIFIDNYDIINNRLYVLANCADVFDGNIDVFVNGEKIKKNVLNFPQKNKTYFDYTYYKDFSFEFNVNLSTDEKYEIDFRANGIRLAIDFSRPCNFSKVVGYAKTKDYLSILKDNKILIEKKTTGKWIKQEIKSIIHMLKERKQGYKVGIPFRIAYMLGYPFLKNKHIWFFMDRPDSGDDNGMHMFKYAADKDKDIAKYFILQKNGKNYSEIKKIGKVLPFKSIKHRYLGLFVENIITSHPDNQIIYPFWASYPHLAGLLKSNTTFLQHGIIKDDISGWLNRYDMNLSLFITSSIKEYDSVFENPYNYPKDIVKLLGLPRFDGLENEEDKKQIIIMPSWRRYLDDKSHRFISKTKFFKNFNSLINNEKLIKKAKEYGYEIIFRPHPNIYKFIDMYDTNDYVKIDLEQVNYQTLFNKGSLLITDYSSVAFDFSYLKKPILYYQYVDDYHFDVETGYFKYESMGFGEVCKSEDELVDLIIEYIENDCQMKDEYSKRVDEFYFYTDKNNCERVYNAIKEIPLKD